MGQLSPQRHANPNNPMILVRAVNRFGLPSYLNRVVAPASNAHGRDLQLTGEISVYALGEVVDVIIPATEDDYDDISGTSFAAPQIAGLAACLLKVPEAVWPAGHVSKSVKDYIVAKKRTAPRSPDGIGIAYNGIDDIQQFCQSSTIASPKPRRWSIDAGAVLDVIAKILKRRKRQAKNRDYTIFKDGHLVDPKYSDQPAYKPITTLPITHQVCYSDPKFKGLSVSFHEEEMSLFTKKTCSTHKSFPITENAHAKNGKDTQLYLLVATSAGFREKACLDGFYLAMNNCDPEAPEKKFGGDVQVGDVHYYVYANRTIPPLTSTSKPPPAPSPSPAFPPKAPPPAPPEDVSFPKPSEIACNAPDPKPDYSHFEVPDMRSAIQSTCKPGNQNWATSVVAIAENCKTNLNLLLVDLKPDTPWTKELCRYGFNAVLDPCEKEKTLHYGGQGVINSIRFSLSASPVHDEPRKIKCYAKSKAIPFHRPDVRMWIREVCNIAGSFTLNYTKYEEPAQQAVAVFVTSAVEGKRVVGFDRAFCVKGFESVVDSCNKGKNKDKENLWGGECIVGDVFFNVFPFPGDSLAKPPRYLEIS
ncbi:MAG: hypothetical protein Q9213_003266 [Squamulea squamosa]